LAFRGDDRELRQDVLAALFFAGCQNSNEQKQDVASDGPGAEVGDYVKKDAGQNEAAIEKLTVDQKSAEKLPEKNVPEKKENNNSNEQAMQIETSKKYSAILQTTEGEITVELFADKTPITANNFVALAKKKLYDGTIFHRVIKDFMIQGGDPKGDGTGGPGYKFDDEPFEGEYTRGTVAMANSGPDTNGSQFFIMHKDYALPKNYVIFGKVSSGIEVVDKIAEAPVGGGMSGENSKPLQPVKVTSIEIKED